MHVVTDIDVACCPRGNGPTVSRDDGVVGQQLIQVIGDNLGLHRHIGAGAAFLHQLTPLLHALLGREEKAAVLFVTNERQQRLQHVSAVADETYVGRIAETNTGRINVDLYGLGLAGLGIELQIGEATPSNDQGVAFL